MESRPACVGLYYITISQLRFIISPAIYDITCDIIIHEENTKKNHKRVVSLYVIEIHFTTLYMADLGTRTEPLCEGAQAEKNKGEGAIRQCRAIFRFSLTDNFDPTLSFPNI